MSYKNLNALLSYSTSSRQYFLSLPVELQLQLHQYNDSIYTLQQLHQYAYLLDQKNHDL